MLTIDSVCTLSHYAYHNGQLTFAPEIKGVLCNQAVSRKLDLIALAQYTRFQHLLGTRTFFEEIQLLPPAVSLVYDLSSTSYVIKPYWTFDDIPAQLSIRFEDAVEETNRLLSKAVTRLSDDPATALVFTSVAVSILAQFSD